MRLHICTGFTDHLKKHWILSCHDSWQRFRSACTSVQSSLTIWRSIEFLAIVVTCKDSDLPAYLCSFHCPPDEVLDSWLSWCLADRSDHISTVFTVHLKKHWILGYHDAWQRLIRLHICTFFTIHLKKYWILGYHDAWQRLIRLHISTVFTVHLKKYWILGYHDAWQRLIRLHISTVFTVHLKK